MNEDNDVVEVMSPFGSFVRRLLSLTSCDLEEILSHDVSSCTNRCDLLIRFVCPFCRWLSAPSQNFHVGSRLLKEDSHSLRERTRICLAFELGGNVHSRLMSRVGVIGVESLLECTVSRHLTLTLVELLQL
ncbi:hypothetical protein PFISCL1PPCAC_26886, partial [Pristionchus fissidentatus]